MGNAEDDLLVAGTTADDNDLAALDAIMAEWSSSADYASRASQLMGPCYGANVLGGVGVFLRADPQPSAIVHDGSGDVLTGSLGQDWFWANTDGSGVRDKVTDLSASEFASDLDFINT